jgi:hypothetical protein
MMEDRFLNLRKKARKGLRGWPMATVAFYGPNLSQATKVTVGIVPSENAEVKELRDWKVDHGDIRADPGIAQEILEFIEQHRVLSVIGRDDRLHNRLPSPRRNRLRRRMVSSLRVLAWTRSLYGADGQLDSRCSYRRGDRMTRCEFILPAWGAVALADCGPRA